MQTLTIASTAKAYGWTDVKQIKYQVGNQAMTKNIIASTTEKQMMTIMMTIIIVIEGTGGEEASLVTYLILIR